MEDLFPNIHWTNLLIIPGLLIGYTIHELAHAFAAYFLGDYSQVERGKITLNPFRHISWFGFFSFLLFKDSALSSLALLIGSTPLMMGVFFGSFSFCN